MNIQKIAEKYANEIGEEAAQEMTEDFDFFYDQFGNEINACAIASVELLACGMGIKEILQIVYCSGISDYRKFLQSRGIDIREAEGRI